MTQSGQSALGTSAHWDEEASRASGKGGQLGQKNVSRTVVILDGYIKIVNKKYLDKKILFCCSNVVNN
jgi:hypothetical protein